MYEGKGKKDQHHMTEHEGSKPNGPEGVKAGAVGAAKGDMETEKVAALTIDTTKPNQTMTGPHRTQVHV